MWWATINILPRWPVNIGQRWDYKIKFIDFSMKGGGGSEVPENVLEEHAALRLSVKDKAVELISRARVLNISSELK